MVTIHPEGGRFWVGELREALRTRNKSWTLERNADFFHSAVFPAEMGLVSVVRGAEGTTPYDEGNISSPHGEAGFLRVAAPGGGKGAPDHPRHFTAWSLRVAGGRGCAGLCGAFSHG
ncbi:hypothetical protein E2C01_050441 [Portunus trituberculatus]|uniref:Uncharacterized protein n=1 Tax=Portunus trituberculatus TaxID=210409 RepID=A0A5B7G8A3_PORTR|nr:hypothetical protein [Portunus trituberculatus]